MKKFRKLYSLIAMVLISVLLVGDLSPAIPVYAEDVSAADTVSRVDPLVYDFEFLSTPVDGTVYDKPVTAGWTVESGASKTTTVEDSLWKINVEAASYTLQGEKNVAIESALYPSFRMSVLNKTAATKATLFFTTDADTSYTTTKSLSLNIQPNDTVYREYMFDMSTVSSWSGIIGQVKIVFESASGEAGGQLNVDYFSFAPNTVPADVIFDLSEGQECIENVIFAVQGGDDALVLTPTGPNAIFETVDNLGLDAAQFNYFKISLQNSSSAKRLRVSFITESSPVWNTEKSLLLDDLKTSDSGLSYYAFNMSSCDLWQGRIRKLRVTFEDSAFNDSNITITAIGIFTGVILEDQVFDFTSSHEGWTAGKNTALSQKNNSLTVNISGKDAYYCSPEVYINADEMRYITLKLKNATASSAMRIQWVNDGDDGFNDIKSQNIVIKPNSPMQEYVVALGDHQRWEGIVTGLKITPALYNVDLKVVIYSNAEGDGVLFQNKDNWWKAPEGTDNNNKCQFFLNNGIYDSAENVIKMEGGKAYLQCGNYMLPEIKGDLTFSKTQTSEELSIWKLQAVTNGYRLKNKATGLYMTMEAYGDTYRLFQASDRGIDDASQCFTFKKYNEYYFLCQADLNVVIYSDTNGNRILYQNYADWAVPPEGANSNNKCQFKLATAPKDKAEIVIKMSGNGAYLRAYTGTAFITAKADGNGIVSSAQKAEIGTNVTVIAKANNGYLFDGWYMDGERVADTASYTFTAQENVFIIARFRLFYGDIDLDGEITLYDVVAVRTELLTDNEYSAVYDVNQNGEFDICDLVRIKKILVGLA